MANKLSKYRAVSSTMGDISESLSSAAGYGYQAYGAEQKGLRQQQGIADTLDSLKKVAGAVKEYRQESQFRKQTGDIARGAYGIETVEEKGFLGIPKTTYQDIDTGEKLSMMDIYATKKFGEGSEKYKRWFGEEAQRERGMKEIGIQQEKDIASAADAYKARISKAEDDAKRLDELTSKMIRTGMLEGKEVSSVTEIVEDDSDSVKRNVKSDDIIEEAVSPEERLNIGKSITAPSSLDKTLGGYIMPPMDDFKKEISPLFGYEFPDAKIDPDIIEEVASPEDMKDVEWDWDKDAPDVKRKPGSSKQIGPGRQPLIDPQDQMSPPDSVIQSLKMMDEDIAPLDLNYGNKDVAIATLLGEAGTEGRAGMEAVLGTMFGRQDALMKRGEGDFSLEQIALAPSQYTFWNEIDVRNPDAMLDVINKMKSDNPRGWELAADVLKQSRGVGSSPIHSYLNPDLADPDELKRFQSLPGQEFPIGRHIFKSAPDSVLSPDYLWQQYGGGQI